MSADNGLLIRKADERFEVFEYNASTGSEYHLTRCRTLEDAVRWATHYQQENVVEYGTPSIWPGWTMPDSNQESPARAEAKVIAETMLRSGACMPPSEKLARAYLDSEAKLVALREVCMIAGKHLAEYEAEAKHGKMTANSDWLDICVRRAREALAASEEKGE